MEGIILMQIGFDALAFELTCLGCMAHVTGFVRYHRDFTSDASL